MLTSLLVDQIGKSEAERLETSLDISGQMLKMEARQFHVSLKEYYLALGMKLGVECPSDSGIEVRQAESNGSQVATQHIDLHPVALPRRRETPDAAKIPNHVSLSESYSYPPKARYCSQIGIESLLYNLRFGAVKPRFVNIPEIPEAERTKERVMAHLESLAEKGVEYLAAGCSNHSANGQCLGHPTGGV